MSFDLYFAGNGSDLVLAYKLNNNINQLFSQLNERKSIENWISNVSHNSGKLFIDSGAWSAHSKGKQIDVDEYVSFINKYDDYITIFAQVDKIPGEFRKHKTIEQKLEAPKLSWENYLYMKDRVVSRDKLLPVFHQGEDFKWLEKILEYRHEDTGKPIPYIGISPANDSPIPGKLAYIDKCFEIIKKSSNPNVKTHAFGMTSLNILEKYPFTSADSTTYLMAALNGEICTSFGRLIITNKRFVKNNLIYLSNKELILK